MEIHNFEKYMLAQNTRVHLSDYDADETSLFPRGKKASKKELIRLSRDLDGLQELLYAEHKHKILVVLQAMDTGGKDGTVRTAYQGFNPQGFRVVSFKAPTPIELDHDYLWRVHKQIPGKGEITVFNRSHYEDVLLVRVHHLVPEETLERRYKHINDFERILADEGTTILKFFLNISKDEQKERLQARLDDKSKNWKFNPVDLKERKSWKEYVNAYEHILSQTSTDYAPWYVIPANKKWYRDLAIASITVQALQELNMQYPKSSGLDDIVFK
jgi:PPK2 family polyphosphate:nucleotide phosphotransferase